MGHSFINGEMSMFPSYLDPPSSHRNCVLLMISVFIYIYIPFFLRFQGYRISKYMIVIIGGTGIMTG